jgi:hypothetical protein
MDVSTVQKGLCILIASTPAVHVVRVGRGRVRVTDLSHGEAGHGPAKRSQEQVSILLSTSADPDCGVKHEYILKPVTIAVSLAWYILNCYYVLFQTLIGEFPLSSTRSGNMVRPKVKFVPKNLNDWSATPLHGIWVQAVLQTVFTL